MSGLWVPQPRVLQPQNTAGINWANSLARGLVTAVLPPVGPTNLAGPETVTFGSSLAGSGTGRTGVARVIKQTGTQAGIVVADSQRQRTAEVTAFVLFRRTGTVDANTDVWWKNYNNNTGLYVSWSITLNNGGLGQNIISTYTGGFGASGNYTVPDATQWTTAAYVKSAPLASVFLYVNGAQRASLAAAGSLYYGTTGDNAIRTNFGKTEPIDVAVALTWNRALTALEIAQVSANPWQLFAPQKTVGYFVTIAGTNVTASIAATQAADSASSTVVVTDRAEIAATQAPDTAAISATVTNQVSIAATQAPDTAAISVSLGVTASIVTTQAPDTAAISATVTNQISIAPTQAPDTAAINVSLGVTASIAATQAPDTAAISADVTDRASIVVTQAPDTAASTVTIAVTANIAATQAPDTAAVSVAVYIPVDASIVTTQAPNVAAITVFVESNMQAGVGSTGVANLANTSDGGALYTGAKNVPITDPAGANVGDGGVVDLFTDALPVSASYISVEVGSGYVVQEDGSKIVLQQS